MIITIIIIIIMKGKKLELLVRRRRLFPLPHEGCVSDDTMISSGFFCEILVFYIYIYR